MSNNKEENNLDIFFEMIDSVEDDISKLLEDESNQLGGYECLVICFNYLKLYCGQVGIKFSQIEDNYNAFKENKMGDTFLSFDIDTNSASGNEIEEFRRILEEIENSLAVFEQRCKKTEELFDEWNCVFIMYSCIRKFCDETKTDYAKLMNEVSRIQDNLEKDVDAEPGNMNSLN